MTEMNDAYSRAHKTLIAASRDMDAIRSAAELMGNDRLSEALRQIDIRISDARADFATAFDIAMKGPGEWK